MSHSATTRFLPKGPLSIEETKGFVASATTTFAISLSEGSTTIGHLEFGPWFGDHTYEIGWAIHPSRLRKGYAHEAARAALEYGFRTLNLHRMVATCQPENEGSHKLMEKLGMVREGYFRECIPKGNGVWWDEYFYSMIETDFEAIYKPTG